MRPLFAMVLSKTLVHLSGVDYAIVALHSACSGDSSVPEGCANTGAYLHGRTRNDCLAAGLSFLSANLGALELMGWAGSAYQYGILRRTGTG